jgi:hypothetical protein
LARTIDTGIFIAKARRREEFFRLGVFASWRLCDELSFLIREIGEIGGWFQVVCVQRVAHGAKK